MTLGSVRSFLEKIENIVKLSGSRDFSGSGLIKSLDTKKQYMKESFELTLS